MIILEYEELVCGVYFLGVFGIFLGREFYLDVLILVSGVLVEDLVLLGVLFEVENCGVE